MPYDIPEKIFPRVVTDVETTSELDLKRVGAYKYATHPSTRVLTLSWRVVHSETMSLPIYRWKPGEPVPPPFTPGQDPFCVAHNAAFERLIFRHQLEVYGFVHIPDHNWSCTMLRAAYHGYPMGLDDVAEAMNLPFGKDKDGHRVMMQMAKPRTRSPLTWWDETDPVKFKKLQSYCDQDVAVETILDHYLPELPKTEKLYWLLDMKMNDDGMPLDMNRVREMQNASATIISKLDANMNKITGGAVPDTRKVQKLKDWAKSQYGFEIKTLGKDKIDGVLDAAKLLGPTATPLMKAIGLRKTAAKSSIAKLNSMEECEDGGRARGVFQFYGATRTGRYAGRLIQPQNFPRPVLGRDEIEVGFLTGHYDLTLLSSALRSCIKPRRKDNVLVVVDFSQIEARVLVWLAEQDDVVQAFSRGEDVYTLQAKKLGSNDRTLGKVVQLACGYGMGGPKFRETAANFGLDMTEDEARNLVYAWRNANAAIPGLWVSTEHAARYAFTNPAYVKPCCIEIRTRIMGVGKMQLEIELPSGRVLTYLDPEIIDGDITYMGMNQYTRKWERIKTYGGKLVENIVQAVARDLMMELMLYGAHLNGARLIGTVHDEIIIEAPENQAESILHACLTVVRSGGLVKWAKGLPLDAEGAVMARYGK